MSKTTCKIMMGVAIALGVARFADLCLFAKDATGVVTAGSAWMRYGVAAVFVLVLLLWPYNKNAKPKTFTVSYAPFPFYMLTGILALVSCALMGVYAVSQLINPTTAFGMAELSSGYMLFAFAVRFTAAVGFACFGAWQILLSKQEKLLPQKGLLRTLGFCSLFGFGALVVLRYVEMPASVHHINVIALIFTALAALVYTNKLLGVLCVDFTAQFRRGFQSAGIFLFFMSFCLGTPHLVWQMFCGALSPINLFIALTMYFYGVTAAIAVCKNAD